jgi:L-rhamnose mutarotase
MNPTTRFRWLIFNIVGHQGEHPSASIHAGNQAKVLQQWWAYTSIITSTLMKSDGEWKDVPMEQER